MVTLESVIKKYITSSSESSGLICSICSLELLPEESVRLKCKHEYHHNCIYNWYKKTLSNDHGSASSKSRECPYCRQPGGYLSLLEGQEYEKNVHAPSDAPSTKVQSIKLKKCGATTKTGKPCKLNGHYGGYCHIHKKNNS